MLLAAFLLLVAIWGTTWATIRVSLEGFPPFTGVAIRFAIAAAVLLALAKARGVRLGALRSERWLWWSNGLLSFCGSYAVVYWCEQWVPSGLASILFATFPLLVAVMAHVAIPGESLTLRALGGVAVGFAGVAVIFSEDFALLGGRKVLLASCVMLVSPFVSAISNVIIKRFGAGIHPVSLSSVPMAIAAGVMGALAWTLERDLPFAPTPRAWAALVYLAVFGSAVTFTLYYWLLSHVSATRASLIAYLTPVVAVAIGAIALDEPVTARTLGGSALVLAGVALAVSPSIRIRALE